MSDNTVATVEIRGGPGRASFASLRELWRCREVFSAFAVRHVKVKYKQAAVGVGWAVLQPAASAAVFALFLGRFVKVPSEGAPYLLFALSGTVCWTYFATALGQAMDSLVADGALLRKVYFPREVLPLASVAAALVDFVPGVATLLVAALLYGTGASWTWLALPLPALLLILLSVALGLLTSSVNVYYRDVRYVLPFVLQFGLFASPVVYSLEQVPERWRTVYAVANPVAAAIDGVRRIVLHHELPDLATTSLALLWCAVLCVAGYAVFKRLERAFSDRI